MTSDPIFTPLALGPNLTIKNRVLRSSISGRFDNEDGSLTQTRINWETKFARGGVGAIISSFVAVAMPGRIVPGFATIHRDSHIPQWEAVGRAAHAFDCKFILQLSHAGRQRDMPGVHNGARPAPSATSKREPLHGFAAQAMAQAEIDETIDAFARGAWRAREAGLDGIELHACHGYLFSQFLSSAINDRKDHYGGSLENRARFLMEVIAAIRAKVGAGFHLQVKLSAIDMNNVDPTLKAGNTIADTVKVAQWCEAAGVDAIHVSTGAHFPHPLSPAGPLPMQEFGSTYDVMISSGLYGLRNYLVFRMRPFHPLVNYLWHRLTKDRPIEGVNLPEARLVKKAVKIPVVVTGGWQSASAVRAAISGNDAVDGVTIARALVANNDLLQHWADGRDVPPSPCNHCNKCLAHLVKDPLGCYEVSRFESYDAMIDEIMSVYEPRPQFVLPTR